jgi:hypothetical protein
MVRELRLRVKLYALSIKWFPAPSPKTLNWRARWRPVFVSAIVLAPVRRRTGWCSQAAFSQRDIFFADVTHS